MCTDSTGLVRISGVLLWVTMTYQENEEIGPSVLYAGSLWEEVICKNDGTSVVNPGFRLACWVKYDCSFLRLPKESVEDTAVRER